MSTRSGRRIHKSLHEDNVTEATNKSVRSERKTRSRRPKDDCEILNISLPKTKKRENYVAYPSTDDELISDRPELIATELKSRKASRKTTLRELNFEVNERKTDDEMVSSDKQELKSPVRQTRRTRRFAENNENDNVLTVNATDIAECKTVEVEENKKGKRNKKKQKSFEQHIEFQRENASPELVSKSMKKKKTKTFSTSPTQEQSKKSEKKPKSHNASTASTDSFHSASETPPKSTKDSEISVLNGTSKVMSQMNSSDGLSKKQSKCKKRDNQKSPDPTVNVDNKNNIELKQNATEDVFKSTTNGFTDVKKNTRATRKSLISLSDDKHSSQSHNSTYDKSPLKVNDSTFDKSDCTENSDLPKLNATFDKSKDSDIPKLNSTFDKSDVSKISVIPILNSTFDKNNDPQKSLQTESNSSLVTLDTGDEAANLTFDKSEENTSRISITSDDSKASFENIVNNTPVLIESSLETSKLSETFRKSMDKTGAFEVPTLHREGTFTKDSPNANIVTQAKTSTENRTPIQRKLSLPSPGSTLFVSNSKIEQSILNVTRSIERPARISSVMEQSRNTKVMFCSPINNHVTDTSKKSKVIKSSMKGSNKSFIFNDSVRPASRKRSYTHNDVEEGRAKRKKLGDELQESVNRLSRPRTPGASAKSTESTTPVKKVPTPARTKSEGKLPRGRLPDFAALHQRRFQKMESLDECQERKAKRAKQLLVPTGGLTVLERSSPKAIDSPNKIPAKDTDTKKQPTPSRLKPTANPNQKQPGYTRFGFKLNLDVNPFSILPKPTEELPKEKINRDKIETVTKKVPLKRQPTVQQLKREKSLPSLAGATALRKEVAKRVVLKEKSSTSLRDKRSMSRTENRTIIKGVRTNRRFELQMQSRNINA